MDDSIREPAEDVEHRIGVFCKNVGYVCPKEYVFERGQYANRDRGTQAGGNEPNIDQTAVRSCTCQGTSTYRQEKKKMSQVATGKKGRKNCEVMGTSNSVLSNVMAAILNKIRASAIVKAKASRDPRSTY